MFNLNDIIDIAVRLEQNAERVYLKAVREVTDQLICSMFARLASDEIEHRKWFEALKVQTGPIGIAPSVEEMGKTMLQNIVGDRAFSVTETDMTKIENIKALLDVAIEFENDTIIFYEMISGFVTDVNTANGLKKIIDEENRHIRQLTESFEKGEFSRNREKRSPT